MKKLFIFIFITFTNSAIANSVDYIKENVIWINAGIGHAQVDSNSLLIDEGSSLKLNIGYDFNEYFALFGGIGSFRNLDSKNINYLEAGLKGNYPLSDTWSIYTTLAGTSVTSNSVSGKVKPKIGVGISYQITPKFSTQISYDYFKEIGITKRINEDVQQITWGFTYFFNRPETANKTIQQIKIYQ